MFPYLRILFFLLCIINGHSQDTLYICNPGDAIQLEAERGDFLYLWSPQTGLSNATVYNPTARPLEETTYIVQKIKIDASENLISNPDFSEGNQDFTSDYPFVESINIQGVYGVNTSAKNLNSIFFEDCPDHTSGDGLMMVIDGSPVANERVWCQTIEVKANSLYAFSSWLTSVKTENPAMLKFSINGVNLGSVFTASQKTCEWRQFYELWNSRDATVADICIVNQNTNPTGNDFALDDFSFFELQDIEYDTIVVIVEALVAAENRNVFIPTAFSPNEDGINDFFEIFIGKGTEEIVEIKIFDSWGNRVFDGKNCNDSDLCSWDGNLGNSRATPGTYIYTSLITFADGTQKRYNGTFLLMR